MQDRLSEYARLAAEAFAAAALTDDPVESATHRARGYELVGLIHQQERSETAER